MKQILAHSAIVLSLFYLVLFVIDKVNMYMDFINNDITKALLLLLAIVSSWNAVTLIRRDRALKRKKIAELQKKKQLKKAAR